MSKRLSLSTEYDTKSNKKPCTEEKTSFDLNAFVESEFGINVETSQSQTVDFDLFAESPSGDLTDMIQMPDHLMNLPDCVRSENPLVIKGNIQFPIVVSNPVRTRNGTLSFHQFAKSNGVCMELLCSYNDAQPSQCIQENSCVLLTPDVQHLGQTYTIKCSSNIAFSSDVRNMVRHLCASTMYEMKCSQHVSNPLMSDETRELAEQYARPYYALHQDVTLQSLSKENIYEHIDWHKVYRENNEALKSSTNSQFCYPARVSIGTKNPEIRPFCLLDILSLEGKGKVKGKVLGVGAGDQLRKNLYLSKITLLSEYNGKQCVLPLKMARSCVAQRRCVIETTTLSEDEHMDLIAQYKCVEFRGAKHACYKDVSDHGYLYSEDRRMRIGKFVENDQHIVYVYYKKPYTIRLFEKNSNEFNANL